MVSCSLKKSQNLDRLSSTAGLAFRWQTSAFLRMCFVVDSVWWRTFYCALSDVDHFVCFSVFLQCSEPEKDLAKILNEPRRLTTAR
jgi:hypothetical protein